MRDANTDDKVEAPHQRNAELDGLRGYAAIAVVYFHSILGIDPTLITRVLFQNYIKLASGYEIWAKIWVTLLNGHTAVVIFFILSGAVLFKSLIKEDGRSTIRLAADFGIKRVFRIYPALIVCLLSCWAAFNLAGIPMSSEQLLQNLVLFSFPINGATWTLNVEMFGIALILLCFLAYRRFREIGIVIVGAIFAAAYLKIFDGYLIYFKMFIYSFCLGAFIPTPLGKRLFSQIPGSIWPILLIALIVSRHTIQETIAAFLVGLIYYGRAGAFARFLAKPFSVFLGRISYSMYLFNVLFIELFNDRLRTIPLAVSYPVEFGLISGTIIVALTIPVAMISTRYIEEPFINFGRTLTTRWRPHASPKPSDVFPSIR